MFNNCDNFGFTSKNKIFAEISRMRIKKNVAEISNVIFSIFFDFNVTLYNVPKHFLVNDYVGEVSFVKNKNEIQKLYITNNIVFSNNCINLDFRFVDISFLKYLNIDIDTVLNSHVWKMYPAEITLDLSGFKTIEIYLD